jgi:hypothetical protein
MNHDGQIDYVVGNQGTNSRYTTSIENPLRIFVNDFSNKGNNKSIITYTQNGKAYPIHPRDDLMQQLPGLRKKFSLYHDYANATILDLFPAEKLNEATSFSANTMQTSVLINQGDSKWKLSALPIDAQFAPVFGTLINDYDGDGLEDIILIGNDFSAEEINGQYDAFNGLVLKGDGKGGFYKEDNAFKVKGDGKGLAEMIVQKNTSLIIAAQNNDQLLSFLNSEKQTGKIIRAEANDAYAIIQYADGKKLKKEFYYGSGYLSCSSRFISIPVTAKSIQLVSYQGKQRIVLF